MTRGQLGTIGLLLAFGLVLGGCRSRTKTTTVTTPDGSTTVQTTGESTKVTTADGSASFQTGASLPDGFPSAVPTPSFGTITASYGGTDASAKAYTVTYALSSADAATGSSRYQDQLKAAGYSVEGSVSTNTGSGSIDVFTATKDTFRVGVTVTRNGDGTAALTLAVTDGVE